MRANLRYRTYIKPNILHIFHNGFFFYLHVSCIFSARNNRGIARAPPGRLGATPWAAPERKEDNKSFENNAGSGSRARPALGINICYGNEESSRCSQSLAPRISSSSRRHSLGVSRPILVLALRGLCYLSMDRPSQFSPSQARRRPPSRLCAVSPRKPSSRHPQPPPLPTARRLHYGLSPWPRRSYPASTDRRTSTLLPQNCLTFRGRTFVFAPRNRPLPAPTLAKICRTMPRRRRSQPAIRNSNPCRPHAFGRCNPAAEPNPIRHIRRCRSRDAGRRALSAAEPDPTRYTRRGCPFLSQRSRRINLGIARALPGRLGATPWAAPERER